MTTGWWLGHWALVLVWAVCTWFFMRRARRVWQGESIPGLPLRGNGGPEINRRNYPVFVVLAALFSGGGVFIPVARALGWTAVAYVSAACAGLGLVLLFPLLIVINAYNRPRLLVPPSQRSHGGARAESRARRGRRQAGVAPTDHTVEILDVRSEPGEVRPFPPYFVAVCTADDCDWLSDTVDQTIAGAEQSARKQAAEHSSVIVGPRRPVG